MKRINQKFERVMQLFFLLGVFIPVTQTAAIQEVVSISMAEMPLTVRAVTPGTIDRNASISLTQYGNHVIALLHEDITKVVAPDSFGGFLNTIGLASWRPDAIISSKDPRGTIHTIERREQENMLIFRRRPQDESASSSVVISEDVETDQQGRVLLPHPYTGDKNIAEKALAHFHQEITFWLKTFNPDNKR